MFQAVEEGQRELDVDGRGERDLTAVLSDDPLELDKFALERG